MRSNKLVYKKVYVNSKFRLPQSRSPSGFVIELQENMELPAGRDYRSILTHFVLDNRGWIL